MSSSWICNRVISDNIQNSLLNRKSIDKKQSKSSTLWKKFEKLISCNFFYRSFPRFCLWNNWRWGHHHDQYRTWRKFIIIGNGNNKWYHNNSNLHHISNDDNVNNNKYSNSLKFTRIHSNLLKFFLGHPTTLPRSCPAPDITYNGSLLTTNEAFKDIHDVEFEVKTGPFPGDRRRCKLSCVAGQWVGPLCRKNEGMLHINKNI